MKRSTLFLFLFLVVRIGYSQNPVFTSLFTADPAVMVAGDTVYVFTGHDEAAVNGSAYVMNDWHVFSSTDMINWTDHGEVLKISDFVWATANAWASHAIERNGKYYWYVTLSPGSSVGGAFAIGVAVSDHPAGPYSDAIETALITDDMTPNLTYDIDPAVFIDDDGQAYLYWGNGGVCKVVRLKDNMIEKEGDIIDISPPHFTEAAYMHKRNGIYYLSYAGYWPETIEYATSDNPLGPFTHKGTLNARVSSSTNHQSVIEFKGQWYFVYHTADLPTGGDYRRSVAIEYLFYNDDNSIREIVQTPYGVIHADSSAKCPPLVIEPLYQVDDGGTANGRHIILEEGDKIILQPDAGSESATWQWELDGTILSTSNTLILEDIQVAHSGIYLAVHTRDCGTKSFISYDIKVNYALPQDISSGETYVLECVASSQLLSVENNGTSNGSNVVQAPDSDGAGQRFVFTLVDGVYWKISPSNAGSRALDVYNISLDDGANIVIWDYWGGYGQQWQIVETGDGVYRLISRNSMKSLDVNLANNNVIQWEYHGGDNQHFRIYPYYTSSTEKKVIPALIYPNPSKEDYVVFLSPRGESIQSYELYDSAGRRLLAGEGRGRQRIEMALNIPAGMYLVQVTTATSVMSGKLFVE